MKKTKTVKLTFIGVRRVKGDKLAQFFLDEKGEEAVFTKVRYCLIGARYLGERTPDGGLQLHVNPERDGEWFADDDKRTEWEVADRVARQVIERKRAAAKFRREPAFLRAAESLRPLVKGLDWVEREELVKFLVNHLLTTKKPSR